MRISNKHNAGDSDFGEEKAGRPPSPSDQVGLTVLGGRDLRGSC